MLPLLKRLSRELVTEVPREVVKEVDRTQLLMVASSLAYTTILSIIPLLAVSFAIFQAFGGLDKLHDTLEPFILSNLAEGSSAEAMGKIREFIDNAHGGALGVGGFIGLVFTSMSMLSSVENAINRLWAAPRTRSLFHRIATYWLVITMGPLAAAVAVGAASSSSKFPLTRLLPSGTGLFVLTIALLSAVYKWVPHCKVRWKYAFIAGGSAAVLFNLAQAGFRLYTARVLSYSKIYGSLGAVPILLLWIYIVWVVILGGAAFSAALQKRATHVARDLGLPTDPDGPEGDADGEDKQATTVS
jgi:membrane protein